LILTGQSSFTARLANSATELPKHTLRARTSPSRTIEELDSVWVKRDFGDRQVDDNNLMPDLRNGTDFMIVPPPDAISEFKVETTGYGPEFGRGGGAAVNVAFKSGTNQFHGDAWEFLQNNAFDARNFFDYNTVGVPPSRENQFGFAAGGPIVRDHTFFFGDYQGTRVGQSESFVSIVPTAAEKLGNFSDGFLGQITDPATGQPFPNQTIPVIQMDPVALKLAQLFPNPNLAGTNEFVSNPLQTSNTDQFDIRLDHQFGEKTQAFGRVDYSKNSQYNPGPLPGLALGGTDGVTQDNTTDIPGLGTAVGVTHIFNPSVVNDLRLGYNRLVINQVELNSTVNAAQQFGIPGIPFISGVVGGLPQFQFSDISELGARGYLPTQETVNVFSARDVLNVIAGTHSMKMGFEGRPSEFTLLQPSSSRGHFHYSGQFTGSGFGDFLIGMPNEADLSNVTNADQLRDNYAAFWGDTWKATQRLTLNYGVRWEYHTPVHEKFGAQAALGLGSNPTYYTSRPVTLPSSFPFPVKDIGSYLSTPQHNDWAPRFGFAYRVGTKTVLRGAYGIFWQAEEVGTFSGPPAFNPPFFIDATFNAVSTTQVNPIVNRLSNGFPADAITVGFDPTAVAYVAMQSNLQDGYVQSWNFTVQRELSPSTTLEAVYVGNKGTHLINDAPGNQATPSDNPNSPIQPREPIPVLSTVTSDILSNAYSNYNALGITLRKRLSRGLSLNAAYTWSHTLDIASDSDLGSDNNGYFRNANDQFLEYGNADFDSRNRLALFYEYELPFGRGRAFAPTAGRWLNAAIGGWSTYGIWTLQSGNWFTPVLSYDASNSNSQSPRPDMICNPNQNAPHTTTAWFNTSCFAAPPDGSFGNAGRNVILGPSYFDADLSVMKDWNISESRRLEFRAEFFNAFNHPTFPAITGLTFFDTPSFGNILSANSPRQIQLALKFYW
jgi:hypothetical protein